MTTSRAWVLLAVVLTSLVVLVPTGADAAEPVGWVPAFSESFEDTAGLPAGCTAMSGVEAHSYDLPDEVAVSSGFLRLHLRLRSYGGRSYTSGGVLCGAAALRYGRYEVRAQAASGPGVGSYLVLRGADRRDDSRLELLPDADGLHLRLTNGYGTGTAERTAVVAGARFHTYVVEWAPSGLRLSVDGRQLLLDAHVSTEQRSIGFGVETGDASGSPDAGTVLPAEFQVDYLRVWSYDPTSSTPPAPVPSTVEAVAPTGGGHLTVWLWGAMAGVLLVTAGTMAVRLTRPRRPRPGHRA